MSLQWLPHVTVGAIVEREGRFLLVEEMVDGRLVLNQPAGHLEENETLLEAVQRETLEETAWHFEPKELVGVYRWTHPTNGITYLRFAFNGDITKKNGQQPKEENIHQVTWMSEEQIRNNKDRLRSPQVLAAIEDYLAGKRFPLDCLRDPVIGI